MTIATWDNAEPGDVIGRPKSAKVERLPDDCLPPENVLQKLMRQARDGWQLDDQGRITGGTTYDGMTPGEVLAERDQYRRMVGE